MLQKMLKAASWVIILGLVIVTVVPADERPVTGLQHDIEHFLAFVLMASPGIRIPELTCGERRGPPYRPAIAGWLPWLTTSSSPASRSFSTTGGAYTPCIFISLKSWWVRGIEFEREPCLAGWAPREGPHGLIFIGRSESTGRELILLLLLN